MVGDMKVGVPSEVKNHEYRVAITPSGVHEFSRQGHEVVVQAGAGLGSSITDEEFVAAGAKIADDQDQVWGEAEMILKVKEPIAVEYERMRPGQILFTYLHLAASPECTRALLDARVTGIAYETVQLPGGALPLLAPMSEVAGRLEVLLLDRNIDKLREADRIYQGHLQTVASNAYEIERAVLDADLVIGAVLVPGAKAPMLISNELVGRMRPGSVLVDIAIDQGGCFEDSRPTTHAEPTFRVHNSVFYCVANMPGAVPNTSTYALTNVTLPYALSLADQGWREAMRADPALALGLNTFDGVLTSAPVAQAHRLDHRELAEVLG
jgi:alanine dehydrogenase